MIIGPLGQDGNLLCQQLPNDEYEVWGICKKNCKEKRIEDFIKKYNIQIIKSDFTLYNNVQKILSEIEPDIVVNFAGISNVFNPWKNINSIHNLNCKLPINILEYIRKTKKPIFFVQSSSSLMYGNSNELEITENSMLSPLYPYGISKAYVHNFIQEYRDKFNIKCCSAIFFNHESPYRSENFLSKKVAIFVAKILNGHNGKLKLGNLSAHKDISHAYDFMFGLKIIIDNKINEDFIFSSNKTIKMLDFVHKFFEIHNLNMLDYVEFSGDGRLETLSSYGNNSKLKSFGWTPSYDIDKLIKEMVEFEL